MNAPDNRRRAADNKTPAEVLACQHAALTLAAEALKKQADELMDTISPDEAGWQDTARFAKQAYVAQYVLDSLKED